MKGLAVLGRGRNKGCLESSSACGSATPQKESRERKERDNPVIENDTCFVPSEKIRGREGGKRSASKESRLFIDRYEKNHWNTISVKKGKRGERKDATMYPGGKEAGGLSHESIPRSCKRERGGKGEQGSFCRPQEKKRPQATVREERRRKQKQKELELFTEEEN